MVERHIVLCLPCLWNIESRVPSLGCAPSTGYGRSTTGKWGTSSKWKGKEKVARSPSRRIAPNRAGGERPVKLQVVYGLGADAGRASLDLLKYELLKAEQVFHRANALPTGGQPARKCVCFFTHNGQYFGSNTRDFIT